MPASAALYVVEMDARVVGLAGIGALAGGDADTCELRKMYFLPEARGLGLGRKMLEELLEFARAAGFRTCYLESLAHMHDARRLYQSAGFTQLPQPMGWTGHSRCNIWMAREL
jgi:putative acetyltransferase